MPARTTPPGGFFFVPRTAQVDGDRYWPPSIFPDSISRPADFDSTSQLRSVLSRLPSIPPSFDPSRIAKCSMRFASARRVVFSRVARCKAPVEEGIRRLTYRSHPRFDSMRHRFNLFCDPSPRPLPKCLNETPTTKSVHNLCDAPLPHCVINE